MVDIEQLHTRLDGGEVILLDGGMGSELQRLGAPMHNEVWCAAALASHPDIVRDVHKSYIEAGADVITTNTYSSARHAMERAGLADNVKEWNTNAVGIAVKAREDFSSGRTVYVAGSVSSFGKWGEYDAAQLAANYREQANILAANGADLILLEMLAADVTDTLPAVEAASATSLPVWVGLSCTADKNSGAVMLGIEESQDHSGFSRAHEPFGSGIERIMAAGGAALLVMHSDLKVTNAALDIMKKHHQGVMGAYPNAGYWKRPDWAFVDQVTPDEYVAEAKQWVNMGSQIVGGCCGIGPSHIKALRENLPALVP